MSAWRQVTRGLRAILRRSAAERDVADEVEHFLQQSEAAHRASGLSEEGARRAARIEMGHPTVARESVRGYGWEATVGTFVSDVRYALRVLRHSPVFTVVAVVVIALGTGAVTTIFSGMNALLLRPLPGTTAADRLVGIERRRPDANDGIQASYEYYDFLRQNTRTLAGLAAWTRVGFVISDGSAGMEADGNLVSGNYFGVMGVRPALGRFFSSDEGATPMAAPVVVLSHAFWVTRFGADSSVIGRVVSVNDMPYTIIGVAPAEFRGAFTPLTLDAWIPLQMQPHLRPGRDLQHQVWMWTFGRMADGVHEAAVTRELEDLTARYIAQGTEPSRRAPYTAIRLTSMTGLPADAQGMALGFLGLLMGAAIFVLLIASVNVAAMLSARALTRRREMAVRVALGAGRGRLVRQLLTEILVLFGAGAVLGMLLAVQATAAIERVSIPIDVPLVLEVSPDLRVFAFALVLSLVTGVVFGLSPALRAVNTTIATREGGGGAGTRRPWMSTALVTGQLALSLVLLVASGLLLQALGRGARVNPGFDMNGVSTATFRMETFGYDSVRGRAFFEALREHVAAAPGVTAVGFSHNMPLAFATSSGRVLVPGRESVGEGATAGDPIDLSLVSASFFDVMRMPLVAGRPIDATDDERSPHVAVVNETFARRFWPGDNAVGRTFTYLNQPVMIVGVARDAKYGSLTETTPAYAYFPVAQHWSTTQVMLVRSSLGEQASTSAIQAAVLAIDPHLPRPVVTTLRASTSIVLMPQRIATMVTASMGLVGLLLSTVGLYGIMAFGVSRRSREIGLRVALGASRRDVLGLIVREGTRLAGIGVVIGVLLGIAVTRLLRGLLLGVSPLDPSTFVGMSALFIAVASLASYLPARRAAGADPMVVLRVD